MIWIKITVLFLTLLYFALEGYREGWYWYYSMRRTTGTKEPMQNIHIDFTIQRLILGVLIGMLVCDALFLFGLLICIPLIHNGAYYMTRQEIDESYKDGIKSQSTTSTAFWTKYFTPKNRLVMFIIGICLILIDFIFI